MGNLSAHFDTAEFACKCGCGFGLSPRDICDALIIALEDVRQAFGNHPVVISSGCRCPTHNRNVGGASSSQHLLGTACDFTVSRASPRDVYNYLDKKYPNSCGIGSYNNWTHFDTRRHKARW